MMMLMMMMVVVMMMIPPRMIVTIPMMTMKKRFRLELPSGNFAARAHAGMEGNVDQMRKEELMKYARSLGVATRKDGTKKWRAGLQRCVKTARLGRRLSRSVLEHTQVSQALPALAWRCGQLHVGPHLRRS